MDDYTFIMLLIALIAFGFIGFLFVYGYFIKHGK